jgi:hypothetical protein
MTIYDTVLNTIIEWAIEGSGNYGLLTRNICNSIDTVSVEGDADNGESFVYDKLEYIKAQQLARFHSLEYDKKVNFIEKVIAKYDSDEYVNRWHKRGIEPEEMLYFFLYEYARKYGRPCYSWEWKKIASSFTVDMFNTNGYYFQWIVGQGSKIIITKE